MCEGAYLPAAAELACEELRPAASAVVPAESWLASAAEDMAAPQNCRADSGAAWVLVSERLHSCGTPWGLAAALAGA